MTFEQLPKLITRGVVTLGDRSVTSYSVTFEDLATSDLCQEIRDSVLVPTRKALLACEHLWHIGCSHLGDPILRGFNREVDRRLTRVGEESIYWGFYLLSDYLYDIEKGSYRDYIARDRFLKLCLFFFWLPQIGPTGALDHLRIRDEISSAEGLSQVIGDPLFSSRESLLEEILSGSL